MCSIKKSMVAHNRAHANYKQERSKQSTLGNSMGDKGSVGLRVVNKNKMMMIGKVRDEPVVCCARDTS